VESTQVWSGGMPTPFGESTFVNYRYSAYCSYTPSPYLDISTTDITLGENSGSTGTFNITSNTYWIVSDDASWLDVSPASGSGNGVATLTATSANTGLSPRTATVTIIGSGVGNKTINITQQNQTVSTKTIGNTEIYSSTSTTANRRAQTVTFQEAGTIQSISIYHNGGSGQVILGVYADAGGSPGPRLGLTPSSAVSSSAGWQTIALSAPVGVTPGQKVWLSWVFQTNPGIRYIAGTPARAESPQLWAGGMPDPFGTSSFANYKYSLYCSYIAVEEPETKDLGNTEVYGSTSTTANRRAQNVTFPEAGTIQSISIYHNGGSGQVILGVYADAGGSPGPRLGLTPSSAVSSSAGWQTIALSAPVGVTPGQKVWLSWVFQTNPGIRYIAGTPARAESPQLWAGGMPDPFGTSSFASYKYSLYCTYTTIGGDEIKFVNEPLDINSLYMDKEKVLIYPNPTEGEITVKWRSRYSNRLNITIYNILGKAVKELQTDPDVNEIRLDLNGTGSGVYLFEMKDLSNNLIINRSRIIKK